MALLLFIVIMLCVYLLCRRVCVVHGELARCFRPHNQTIILFAKHVCFKKAKKIAERPNTTKNSMCENAKKREALREHLCGNGDDGGGGRLPIGPLYLHSSDWYCQAPYFDGNAVIVERGAATYSGCCWWFNAMYYVFVTSTTTTVRRLSNPKKWKKIPRHCRRCCYSVDVFAIRIIIIIYFPAVLYSCVRAARVCVYKNITQEKERERERERERKRKKARPGLSMQAIQAKPNQKEKCIKKKINKTAQQYNNSNSNNTMRCDTAHSITTAHINI